MTDAIQKAREALEAARDAIALHRAFEAVPADRGGHFGPKGKALSAWREAEAFAEGCVSRALAALDAETEVTRRGIYTASKTQHAEKWRALRSAGNPIIATWIDEAGVGETDDFTDLWIRCVGEASSATAVLLYREPGEVLKGAFIEAGAALAKGVPVHAVGCGEFSFVNHPLVTQHDSLDAALSAIRNLEPRHD